MTDREAREEADQRDDAHELKQAAKIAAAAAAVGAALGAARALTENRGGSSGNGLREGDDGDEHGPADEVATQQVRDEAPEQREEPEASPTVEHEQQDLPRGRERYDEGEPHREEREEQMPGASAAEAQRVVRQAREQLKALHGKDAESVSSLERTRDGWTVALEVVEVHRVPESTDVLATYELTLDGDRNLVRYARGRRYYRAQADHGGRS